MPSFKLTAYLPPTISQPDLEVKPGQTLVMAKSVIISRGIPIALMQKYFHPRIFPRHRQINFYDRKNVFVDRA